MRTVGLSWLATAADSVAVNARSVPLRRAQGSFALAWTAEQTFAVALSVVAYTRGGAAAVGLLTAVRSLPAAVAPVAVMPFVLRFGALRVLVWSCVARAAATAAIAVVVAAGASFAWVYLLAIVATTAHTVYRPAHSALLPPLSRTPGELVSANAVRGLFDSTASLVGPALAGIILGSSGAPAAFWVVATVSIFAAVGAARVGALETPMPIDPGGTTKRRFRRLLGSPVAPARIRLLLALAALQTFTRGMFTVLVVVVSMKLVRAGAGGVGLLTAAVGCGALVGSFAVTALTSRRLARWFGVGVALWGLPLAAVAWTHSPAWAVLLLAPIGLGNALVDVSVFTLLGRLTTPAAAPRLFGTLESVIALGVAGGSLAAPLLLGAVGIRGALLVVGLAVPALVALSWAELARIDAGVVVRDRLITLLRRVPMLRALMLPTIEQLAGALEPVTVPAGREVFRQGEPGDAYYVIADGVAEVVGDGSGIRELSAGDGFGEIALLRHVPRTATVRAVSDVSAYALSSASFLAAVTGSAGSREAAAADVAERLRRFTPRQRSGVEPAVEHPSP